MLFNLFIPDLAERMKKPEQSWRRKVEGLWERIKSQEKGERKLESVKAKEGRLEIFSRRFQSSADDMSKLQAAGASWELIIKVNIELRNLGCTNTGLMLRCGKHTVTLWMHYTTHAQWSFWEGGQVWGKRSQLQSLCKATAHSHPAFPVSFSFVLSARSSESLLVPSACAGNRSFFSASFFLIIIKCVSVSWATVIPCILL